jgi:hypothetical protein
MPDMKVAPIFNLARKWISVISAAAFAGGFYGTLASVLVQYGFNFSERESLLYVGMPVALLVAAYMRSRLPKILGFDD